MQNLRQLAERLDVAEAELAVLRAQVVELLAFVDQPKVPERL